LAQGSVVTILKFLTILVQEALHVYFVQGPANYTVGLAAVLLKPGGQGSWLFCTALSTGFIQHLCPGLAIPGNTDRRKYRHPVPNKLMTFHKVLLGFFNFGGMKAIGIPSKPPCFKF
jgi:hypothetical protein